MHELVSCLLSSPLWFCYLRFNKINNITDKSLMGLRKLEMLMLHGNDFHQLPDGAFTELSSLQVQ